MLEIKYIYHLDEDKPVNEYTIRNGSYRLSVLNLGAQVTKIIVPNKDDKLENITLRYHDYKLYKNNEYNIGCLIDTDKFINGNDYFIDYYFNCEILENSLKFTYEEDDKYINIIFTLNENELIIEYQNNLQLNLSHIMFFNLSGNLKEDVLKHQFHYNNELINFAQKIPSFSLLDNSEKQGILSLELLDNGINITVKLYQPLIYYSYGNYFNEQFFVNKGIVAKEYIGIGLLLFDKKQNKVCIALNR